MNVREGASAHFYVSLATEPTENTTLTLAVLARDYAEGVRELTPGSLTFTPTNWSVPQRVSFKAADNRIDEPVSPRRVARVAGTFTGSDYAGHPLDQQAFTVEVRDNDRAGVTAEPLRLEMLVGETGVYTLVLDSEPTGNVTVTFASIDTAVATAHPTSLTFTTTNWETPKR